VCCEGCINKHKQAVPHSVFAEGSLRNRSTDQDIYRILSNIVTDNCEVKIVY
jgi:hypothetical protein